MKPLGLKTSTATTTATKIIFGVMIAVSGASLIAAFGMVSMSGLRQLSANQQSPAATPVSPRTTKSLNLEVVFYNTTTCYIGETCESGDACDSLKDYRAPYDPILTFKAGTLMTLDKIRADSYGYGTIRGVKKCVTTTFDTASQTTLQGYVQEVSDLIYSWTKRGLKIVPRFHVVDADMGSGLLSPDSNSPTGYPTGQNPPSNEFAKYARQAGVDTANMDLFLAFTNPFPNPAGSNSGLLVQTYFAETSGLFNGVPMVKMRAMDSYNQPVSRLTIAPIIHELMHSINIGHYSVSGLTDVYGIQSAEQGPGYDPVENPKPHCLATSHFTNGQPNPTQYFPGPYNWLDPMWNLKPWVAYVASQGTSYCLTSSDQYPDTNPLDPNDHWEDIAGLSDNMKYYKFAFQLHWRPIFAAQLSTSYCKNRKLDTTTLDHTLGYEFTTDQGGGCRANNYSCQFNGLCFDFGWKQAADPVNRLPIQQINVTADRGKKEFVFSDKSQIVITPAEFFADSRDLTIVMKVKFNDVSVYQPLLINPTRYDFFINGGRLIFRYNDQMMSAYPFLASGVASGEIATDEVITPGRWYELMAIIDQGTVKLFIDGELKASSQDRIFAGRFVPQESSSDDLLVYVGKNPWVDQNFVGSIQRIQFYNKAIK